MKKILILAAILLFANNCFAACPTMAEYQAKLQGYQAKSLSMLSGSEYQQMDNLYKDMTNYLNSIAPGCVAYFKSTPTPDCNRLTVMASAYMAMDSDKQPAAKAQIYGLMNVLSQKCQPYQVDMLKMMIK